LTLLRAFFFEEDPMSDHITKYWQKRSKFLLGMLVGVTGMSEEEINEKWTEQVMRWEDLETKRIHKEVPKSKPFELIPGGLYDS
jgi:hypothetical protein